MPATAGRVRMPANNRVHSSAALQTHGIWQSAIGYDPYAPNKDDSKHPSGQMTAAAEPDGENAYTNFQGLLALARITGSNADEARGACRKCGRVGHLTFQCKNLVSLKESKEKHPEAIQAAVLNGLDKLKRGKVSGKEEVESEDEESESESSDSDVDSEIERIIAERSGKKVISKGRKSSKKKKSGEDDSSDSDLGEKKKRGRSKKRSSRKRAIIDSDDEKESRRKRRKEKRKKRDESSDEDEGDDRRGLRKRKSRKEKRRRRSHRYSNDSESSDGSDYSGKRHRRKSHRHESPSDSDVGGSDDSRVGRGAKRSEKSSRKRYHEDDE